MLRRVSTITAAAALMVALGFSGIAHAQINVITVDITPLVSPGPSATFGPTNTIGMALQAVDQGTDFNVTEMTPAAFAAQTAGQLAAFDLIAINNHPGRIVGGIGTTYQQVAGCGFGRTMLSSHDAPRFHMTGPPGSAFFGNGSPGPGVEPFGADDFVRQAALWAGGLPGTTGLLIFNDAPAFAGGVGWDNAELNLPGIWGITDLPQFGGGLPDGGYTSFTAAGLANPAYAGLSDVRFAVNSLSSFAANIGDGSFHSILGTFNASLFIPTEVVINAGVVDVGGFNGIPPVSGSNLAAAGPDGTAITLICEPQVIEVPIDINPTSCPNPLNVKSKGVLPVAILSTANFDATQVDVTTVTLEGVSPLRSNLEDVATPFDPFTGKENALDCNEDAGDGLTDLTLKFDRQAVVGALGLVNDGDVVALRLEGALLDGTPIEGEDVIVIKKKK